MSEVRGSLGIVMGVLDAPTVAFVRGEGTIEVPDARIELGWSLYTDRWHAELATSTRQHAIDGMPVVETRAAVPSGDVVHRAYAVTGPPASVVVEIENASPGPVAVALRVRGDRAAADIAELVRAAPGWREVEVNGDATSLIWPLPHRASVRAVVALAGRVPSALDVRALPAPDDVVRGWSALLARGARVEVDDEALQHAVDGARAALLLRIGRDRPRPTVDDVVALEDWGLDAEAVAAWERLSIRDRRRAARRTPIADGWMTVRAGLASAPGGVPVEPARFLRAVRDVLVTDAEADAQGPTVALFPAFPAEWLGRAVAVHEAPTRHGAVSGALRWHGSRPALLWTAPHGVTVRAPALDPSWSSDAAEGEVLLAPPPDQLLRLATASREGDAVADPGSFS
ncbi:MAG TPA: hypothetical protein VGI86_05335 [Acidimicrobiia bacterium]